MMAYKAQYRKHNEFRVNNVELTQDEYKGEVMKLFASPIVQNEIHQLLNGYAEKLVRLTKTTEETAFCRGALDALNTVLALSEKRTKKVNVL